jgi:ABC-type branched-subunit amino acid transport system substrate-binding protein
MTVRRLFVLLAVLGLVAAGCGSDRGEDESGGAPTEEGSGTTPAGGDVGPGDFGDLTGVCGPNEGGGDVTDTDPAETQGVTSDSITLGTVSDPGFEGRPGLNQEIFDAATAFAEWCNAAGGINGKTIEVNLHDAAITEYQPVMQESCQTDFAIVGSGAVQDNFWPTTGAACGLIDIAGFSVTPEKAGTSGQDLIEARSVQPVPNPLDQFPIGAASILNEDFPGAGDNVGILNADLDTLITQAARVKEAYESIGFNIVHEATYNVLGEANWAPFAAALQQDGVTFLSFVGEGENLALLQQAMDEIGYHPDVTLQDANFYDNAYLEAAGGAAEGTFVRNAFWPFEEADQNPATQQYIEHVEAVNGKVALLGAQAWSAWLLFAQSARDCDLDNDLTRTCVLEAAASVTEWTGGGLHAETNPSENTGPECSVVLQVQDGAFARYAPTDEDYACDPSYVAQLEGDYSVGD